MKILLVIAVLISTTVAFAQDMIQPVPKKELDAVSFMLGTWTGTEKFNMGPGNTTEGKASITGKLVLGERYICSNHSMMEGSPQAMSGMHMMTYDPEKKKYIGYWFDSMAPGAMTMSGELKGNTIQFVSDPTDMPGMGKVVFRATWTLKSKSQLYFTLDMKEGEKWNQVIEGNYTKK